MSEKQNRKIRIKSKQQEKAYLWAVQSIAKNWSRAYTRLYRMLHIMTAIAMLLLSILLSLRIGK